MELAVQILISLPLLGVAYIGARDAWRGRWGHRNPSQMSLDWLQEQHKRGDYEA